MLSPMHPALEAIREATVGTPYEGGLWLVGGAVRDELLGIPHGADFDLVLCQPSNALARFLYESRVSSIPPVVYERFGTAMVMVRGTQIELVTARKESYADDSRKPDVQPASLEEDARRRDFTVNTLMRNLHSGELLDPLGRGLADLAARVLRTPLDPEATFHDDPLRMLRAVRFRWKLGFQPDQGLYEAVRREANRLQIISGERIRDEFVKMLLHPTAASAMRELMDLGLMVQFAPEIAPLVGLDQGEHHHLDAWEHSLSVLEDIKEPDLVLRLAALLHDVGKAQTRFVDEKGKVRFFGHETVGAKTAEKVLRRLKFSISDIEEVCDLIRNHVRLITAKPLTKPAARRLVRDMGPNLLRLVSLFEADRRAHAEQAQVHDLPAIRAELEKVATQTPAAVLDSPLDGAEIMRLLDIPAGADVGKWKKFLADKVLDGDLAPGDKDAGRSILLDAVAQTSARERSSRQNDSDAP